MASNVSQVTKSTTPLCSPLALPSLHTLGLPDPFSKTRHDSDAKSTTHDDILSRWHRPRQSSISSTSSSSTSSSTTITARPSSPYASDSESSSGSSRSSPTPPPRGFPSNTYTLVASTVEEADAFVVVPPPRPYVENISSLSRANAAASSAHRRDQALLLTGNALQYLRHPKFRLAKGARMHPYRIVPRSERRGSASSTKSTNDP